MNICGHQGQIISSSKSRSHILLSGLLEFGHRQRDFLSEGTSLLPASYSDSTADDLKWNYNIELKLTSFQEEDLLPTDVDMLEQSANIRLPLDYATILTSDLIRRIKKIPGFS